MVSGTGLLSPTIDDHRMRPASSSRGVSGWSVRVPQPRTCWSAVLGYDFDRSNDLAVDPSLLLSRNPVFEDRVDAYLTNFRAVEDGPVRQPWWPGTPATVFGRVPAPWSSRSQERHFFPTTSRVCYLGVILCVMASPWITGSTIPRCWLAAQTSAAAAVLRRMTRRRPRRRGFGCGQPNTFRVWWWLSWDPGMGGRSRVSVTRLARSAFRMGWFPR